MADASGKTVVALTERDHELLVSLLKYRYLSTTQVQRLHFPSAQTAARRLRLLDEAGYVAMFRVPATPDRIACLARRGAEAVAEQLAVPITETGWDARREHPKDYLFLQHFLAASDFRITLTQACNDHADVRLAGFVPEHVVESATAGTVKKHIRDVTTDMSNPRAKISHTPDGVFALERAGIGALFFLEVDRGTEVLSNPDRGVLKMVRFYLSSLVGESYQRYQTEFGLGRPFRAFRALFVLSSAERLQNIRQICGTSPFNPEHAKRFVWLTTEDALTDPALLAREWTSLDPTDSRRYSMVPAKTPEQHSEPGATG